MNSSGIPWGFCPSLSFFSITCCSVYSTCRLLSSIDWTGLFVELWKAGVWFECSPILRDFKWREQYEMKDVPLVLNVWIGGKLSWSCLPLSVIVFCMSAYVFLSQTSEIFILRLQGSITASEDFEDVSRMYEGLRVPKFSSAMLSFPLRATSKKLRLFTWTVLFSH